jgi:hypothetical protein
MRIVVEGCTTILAAGIIDPVSGLYNSSLPCSRCCLALAHLLHGSSLWFSSSLHGFDGVEEMKIRGLSGLHYSY